MKTSPKIGDSVSIVHATRAKKNGTVVYVGAPERKARITRVYEDNQIQVASGDVWYVARAGKGKCRWVTTTEVKA